MFRSHRAVFVLLLVYVLFAYCATGPTTNRLDLDGGDSIGREGQLSSWERWVVENARYWEGRDRLEWKGRSFNLDCTGVVMASYFKAGVDLWPEMAPYAGGGVQRLYSWLEGQSLLFQDPRPGDLIFWDNTWDADEDYQWDDYLTHVGLVLDIEEDGRIVYLHHNYSRGIVLAYMHLGKPDVHMDGDRILNSPMRMRYSDRPRPEKWLSSHLLRAFGRPPQPQAPL